MATPPPLRDGGIFTKEHKFNFGVTSKQPQLQTAVLTRNGAFGIGVQHAMRKRPQATLWDFSAISFRPNGSYAHTRRNGILLTGAPTCMRRSILSQPQNCPEVDVLPEHVISLNVRATFAQNYATSDVSESIRARLALGSSSVAAAPADMYTAVSAASLTISGAVPVDGMA